MTKSSDPDQLIAIRRDCVSRLVNELEILLGLSLRMQTGIHSLDLSKSSPQTRKVLQSADKMTQSLDCVRIAMDGLSHPDRDFNETGFSTALDAIYLADVRDRLENGTLEVPTSATGTDGAVELF